MRARIPIYEQSILLELQIYGVDSKILSIFKISVPFRKKFWAYICTYLDTYMIVWI